MKRSFAAIALLLVALAPCHSIPVATFTDMETFVRRAESIVVARVVAVPGPGEGFEDGLYPAEVEVLQVLTGDRKPGRLRIVTIYPMQPGKLYLLTGSRGARYGGPGSPVDTDFAAHGELTVVAVPANFDLALLKSGPLEKQLRAVFLARKTAVEASLPTAKSERERQALAEEKRLLEKALRNGDGPPR